MSVVGDSLLSRHALAVQGAGAVNPWARSSARLTAGFALLAALGLVISVGATALEGLASALTKRLVLTGLGVGAFLVGATTDYRLWRRHNLALMALAVVGLVAALMPEVGARINGARRWIRLPGGWTVQPSEFAKPALCVWLAAYCERNLDRMKASVQGFLVPMGVVCVLAGLILVEPDFGTAVLTGGLGVVVLLVCGTRLVYVLLGGAAALPLLHKLVLGVPYRRERLLAFLNPWQDPQGAGYQLIQSRIAIANGGLWGVGLGAGHQKAGFLPSASNDFVFSVLAEELGFIGAVVVIALFAFVLWEAFKVVIKAREPFGFALGVGLAWLLGAQAAAHVAVAAGVVPTKGLSLPFISAGGSSLLASMFAAGVLVSIARDVEERSGLQPPSWKEQMPGYERFLLALTARLTGRLESPAPDPAPQKGERVRYADEN